MIKWFIEKCFYILTSPYTTLFVGEPFFRFINQRRWGRESHISKIKSVLVIRLDGIGDFVLTTPFLREIRRMYPYAWISIVVQPNISNLVEFCPYLNEVLTYDCKSKGSLSELKLHWRAFLLSLRHLWRKRYDLAIIPRWDIDGYHASFVAYFSGACRRLAYSEKVTKTKKQLNRGYDHLFTHVLTDSTPKHEAQHNLDIIRQLGGNVQKDSLEIWVTKEDKAYADMILKTNDSIMDRKLIAFFLGASEPKRRWSLQNFIELGLWLKEHSIHILVIGGQEDKHLGIELEKSIGNIVINVTGKATLRQTAALLKKCLLYVGNDAGPMHLAAAARIPIIMISCHPRSGSPYHPNSPKRFGPWGIPHHILQPEKATPPCTDGCIANDAHCILLIDVGNVKKVIQNQLSMNINFNKCH
ncbi:glycosyltransferase family 9 protein [Thermodesulfobacteriota bacterium]